MPHHPARAWQPDHGVGPSQRSSGEPELYGYRSRAGTACGHPAHPLQSALALTQTQNMNRPHPLRVAATASALGAALWLAGCAAPAPVPPPHVPPPVSAAPMPAPAAPPGTASTSPSAGSAGWAWTARMDAAAQRLRDQLGGGAEVAQTTDQRLWISLPNEQAFPPGRSAVSKPAGAWLDQVAVALRGLPQAEVQIVGQPDGQSSNTSLALDRAASARDWMVMRGVPARRVAVSGQATKGKGKPSENRLDILIGERSSPSNPPR